MGKPFNRAEEIVASAPGLGSITLGGHTGRGQTFAAAGVVNGDVISYVVANSDETQWEIHQDVLYSSSAPNLPRTGLVASSAGGAAVPFGADAIVYIDAIDADFHRKDSFSTVSVFQNSFVGFDVLSAKIEGYSTVGLGGLNVRRVPSQPSHPWYFRSADRFLPNGSVDNTNGGYWEGYVDESFTVTVDMFGAKGDNATDDLAAIQNAIKYAQMQLIGNKKVPIISFEQANYYCSGTINVGDPAFVDLNRRAPIHLVGRNNIKHMDTNATTLRFPVDVTGIKITSGSFAGSRIAGLNIIGVNGNGNNAHGIHMQTQAMIEQCTISHFSTHGIFVESGGGMNADAFIINDVLIIQTGRDGLHIDGSDSQVGTVRDLQCNAIGGCAIWDTGYYNNWYENIIVEGNGIAGYQTRTGLYGAVVTGSDGKEYMVASPTAEAATATTDPAGTTDSLVWLRLATTGSGYPAYVPGRTYNFGPIVYVSSLGSVFNSIYAEVGYSPPALNNSLGAHFVGGFGFSAISTFAAGGSRIGGSDGGIFIEGGLRVTGTGAGHTAFDGKTVTFDLGGFGSEANNGVCFSMGASYMTDTLIWKINADQGINWNFGTFQVMEILTTHYTGNWGTGSAITKPQIGFFNGFLLGDNSNGESGCQVYSYSVDGATAPVAAGRRGDLALNNSLHFACDARGAGLGYRYAYDHVTAAAYWQPMKISEVTIYAPMTVANLASLYGAAQGDRGMVTNSNATLAAGLGNIVAGGGANIVPVYYDGTNWRIG